MRVTHKGLTSEIYKGCAQLSVNKTKNLIKNLYHGSAKELAASLFEREGLTDEDIAELRAIIDSMED